MARSESAALPCGKSNGPKGQKRTRKKGPSPRGNDIITQMQPVSQAFLPVFMRFLPAFSHPAVGYCRLSAESCFPPQKQQKGIGQISGRLSAKASLVQREVARRSRDGGIISIKFRLTFGVVPTQSLPCVRGGVSRLADGGVAGTNYGNSFISPVGGAKPFAKA